MNLSDVIERVIELSGAIRDYYQIELRKHHRDYPLIREGEVPPPPPPEEAALTAYLASLPDDMVYGLMLVEYVSRWTTLPAQLSARYEQLRLTHRRPEALAYLARYGAALAGRLTFGLERLRRHQVDVNAVLPAQVAA